MGRALLRFALQRVTGIPGKSHRISVSSNGKPTCVSGPPFSLSHSGGFVVCAVTDTGSVGVDVEIPRRRRRALEMSRACFSQEETDWVASQPERRFYMLWVLKEAYSKATGRGIVGGGFDAIGCRISPPTIRSYLADGTSSVPNLAIFSLGTAFLGLATIDCPCSEVNIELVTFDGAHPFQAEVQSVAVSHPMRLLPARRVHAATGVRQEGSA